ncbi:MAG: hypothetical protein FJ276_00965 [Planctomycetes bacterium]|nr:hypothetical protein [Planctomycetota bacterium]
MSPHNPSCGSADCVEIPLEETRQMFATNSPIDCAAVSGTTVQIGRDTMTDEAWKLLEMCDRDVLTHLQATGQ